MLKDKTPQEVATPIQHEGRTQKFTLKDWKGEEHNYLIVAHKATDGIRIVTQLISLAGEPIGRLIDSNLFKIVNLFKDGAITIDDSTTDSEIVMEILQKIPEVGDLGLAGTLGDFVRTLNLIDSPALIQELLKNCTRDNQPLSNDQVFGEVYRQNYGEMLAAAMKSIEVNRFLGFINSFVAR